MPEIIKLAKPKLIEKRIKSTEASTIQIFQPIDRKDNTFGIISEVDKLLFDRQSKYSDIVKECRFYYRHDPLAATVINKIVDIAINKLIINIEKTANITEKSIFESVAKDITPFMRKAALEYLLTGLVIPEIKLTRIRTKTLREKGIKRLNSLLYPTSMWVRDSANVEINSPLISEKESYFIKIDDEMVSFLQNKGIYSDGSEDKELYNEIVKLYPEFVKEVLDGEKKVLLDNPLIIKGNSLEDSPYPIPYLTPALESLAHKRNLRRMDYALASRVISAILHVKVGSDEYPLTEDQEDILDDLEEKFQWQKNNSLNPLERLFALFTNHTVNIEWIFPDINPLLNTDKYESVNHDIMVALGFPRILITGETERSFASDPQIATISPLHTMERLREILLPIVNKVFLEMQSNNSFITSVPSVSWKPINLMSMQLFFQGLKEIYDSGNISRTAYDEAYGYDFKSQQEQRAEDAKLMLELEVEPVAPSNKPGAQPSGRPKQAPEE